MSQEILPKSESKKPAIKNLLGLIIVATAVSGILTVYGLSQFQSLQKPTAQAVNRPYPVKKVTALGRLEPEGEVIELSAPLALDGDRIAQLLVKEGDTVKAGETIAVLDSYKSLQDAVTQAEKEVKVAETKLAQVKAGAKSGEITAQKATIARLQAENSTQISAQKATIARLQAELNNAQSEYQRNQNLYQEGAISASSRDSKRLTWETAQQQLAEAQANLKRIISSGQEQINAAKATLNQIAEVRPVDVKVARAELDRAIATLKQAKTNLEQPYIRAPMVGQIIKIHVRKGEKIGDSGVAEIAKTSQMMVVAEVYQTDISKIKVGQKAIISGQALTGKLEGEVTQIGLQVNRQNVFSNQPGENLDRRVVDVKIRLNPEDSKRASGLTNLQVETAIEL
ncbi:ABC exporter membrane fusion protein [Mastigocoleus sp. MO_188.B34]|uniref:ABC exporter membrane fusion protein n=1 Tax=Mastigocoleus sp. MO_188.B34 TaxID=3036635 RepID=UPI00261B59D8|nr:ABC exporter membrane fusion protein [Mastigocoleus sp. MO_188.B34]MDJ0697912.1 ABC exporter membrane fusion protein [Mastigocoleus sp. MO_188.B34]